MGASLLLGTQAKAQLIVIDTTFFAQNYWMPFKLPYFSGQLQSYWSDIAA